MADKKKTNKRKLSTLVKQQVPEFVLSEHPKFTEFLSSYFLFMESAELNLESITEIDNIVLESQTTATNFATIPFYTRLLEDAAKRRLELDKAMLGAREMMPSNIQNIMLSKQAQQQMASSAFAEEAKALAAQQDAATNFAGLGMQRRFG